MKSLLKGILSFSIAFSPIAHLHAETRGVDFETGMVTGNFYDRTSNGKAWSEEQDKIFAESMARATTYLYKSKILKLDSKTRTILHESNAHEVDLTRDAVRIPMNQIEMGLDSDTAVKFETHYEDYIYVHKITGFEQITTNIKSAGTLSIWAARDGLYAFSTEAHPFIFKTGVPVYRLMPLPENVDAFTDLEFVDFRNGKPDLLSEIPEAEIVVNKDLIISYRLKGDSKIHKKLIPRTSLFAMFFTQIVAQQTLQLTLGKASGRTTNNSIEIAAEFTAKLDQIKKEYLQQIDAEVEKSGASPDLMESAVRNFAEHSQDYLKKMKSSLPVLAMKPRDAMTPAQLSEYWQEGTLLSEAADAAVTKQIYERAQFKPRMWNATKTMITGYLDGFGRLVGEKLPEYTVDLASFTKRILTPTWQKAILGAGAVTLAAGGVTVNNLTGGQAWDALSLVMMQTWDVVRSNAVTDFATYIFDKANGTVMEDVDRITRSQFWTKYIPIGVFMISYIYILGVVLPSISYMYKDLRHVNLKHWQRVFTVGRRIMAPLNKLIHGITVETFAGQRNAYKVYDNGGNPFAAEPGSVGVKKYVPQSLQYPWWIEKLSKQAKQANEQRLRQAGKAIDRNRATAEIGEYLAALVVSYYSQNGGEIVVDPVSLANAAQFNELLKTFRKAGMNERTHLTAEILASKENAELWAETAPKLIESLVRYMNTRDIGPSDPNFDMEAFEYFKNSFDESFKAISDVKNPNLSAMLRQRARAFARLTKRFIVPQVLLGTNYREFAMRNRHVITTEKVANTTFTIGITDSTLSTLTQLATYPMAHIHAAEMLTGSVSATMTLAEKVDAGIALSIFEQGFSSVAQTPTGIDAILGRESARENEFNSSIKNFFQEAPLSAMWSEKALAQYEASQREALEMLGMAFRQTGVQPRLMHQRSQSVMEGLRSIKNNAIAPTGLPGFSTQPRLSNAVVTLSMGQASYIKRIAGDNLPGIVFLVGGTYTATTFLTSALGISGGLPPGYAAMAQWLATTAALGLLTFTVATIIKYTPAGYAAPWAPMGLAMDMLEADIVKNRAAMEQVIRKMAMGFIQNDRTLKEQAIDELKELYSRGNLVPDERYLIATAKMDDKMMMQFLMYSFVNSPLPTKVNKPIAFGVINVAGLTVTTTILYFGMYAFLMKPILNTYATQGAGATFELLFKWYLPGAIAVAVASTLLLESGFPKMVRSWQKYTDKRAERMKAELIAKDKKKREFRAQRKLEESKLRLEKAKLASNADERVDSNIKKDHVQMPVPGGSGNSGKALRCIQIH